MSIHRPPPIQKPSNCISAPVVVSHNTTWRQEQWTYSITSHQTTKISPRSWDTQPYLCIQLNEVITFVQHRQLIWVWKGQGIITSSFFPASSFTSPHIHSYPPISSWAHLSASAWLQKRGQPLVPRTIHTPGFHAPSKSGIWTAFISVAPSESLQIVHTI